MVPWKSEQSFSQLFVEFTPAPASYLIGIPSSSGLNLDLLVIAVNILIACLAIISVYYFNTDYLNQRNAVIIQQENMSSKKNLFPLKVLVIIIVALFLVILIMNGIQTAGGGQDRYQIQTLLPCLAELILSLYASQNKNVRNQVKLVLRRERERFEFSNLYSKLQMCARSSKVNPWNWDFDQVTLPQSTYLKVSSIPLM